MRTLRFEENHIHSTYSDGQHRLQELLEYNRTHNQLDLTFADHVDTKTRWFSRYVGDLRRLRRNYPAFRVRIGCEVKILDTTGDLNTTPQILREAEVVLGSVHFFTDIHRLDRQTLLQREFELTRRLATHPKVDILVHPFSMSQRFYDTDPPLHYIKTIFNLCVKHGIQFEYNAKHAMKNTRSFITRKLQDKRNWRHVSFGSDVHREVSEIGDAAFQLATPVTVLVTGAGAAVAQSIIKSLKLSKVPTRIVAVDHDPLAAGLYRADAAYQVPLVSQPGYIDRLIAICRREGVELLLVGTDIELSTISQNRHHLEVRTGAKVLVSPPGSIAIADDKWKTVQFLKRHRFSYPDSSLRGDVEAFINRHGFPVIIKPRTGARSIGFSVVHNQEDLRERLTSTESPIIQEYLPENDQEYTCAVFFHRGQSYGALTIRRWLRNGDTYKAIIEPNPIIESFVIAVGKHLKIHGPCNFQLRRSGKYLKIFEINCRFSGTTASQSFVGFNVVNALLQHFFFRRPLWKLSFAQAVMLRYWNELFVTADQVTRLRRTHYLRRPESDLNVF